VKLFFFIGLAAVALGSAGCSKAPETKEAVRQAVIDHVASRVNLNSMEVDVTAVTFRGDEATASVDFRPKGGAPGSGVLMNYTLEKKSGKWSVKGKGSDSAGAPHGAGGSPKGGAMGGADLPPGHPTMPPATGQSPPPQDSPKK
jgi:hypothetical protein